MHRKSGCWCTKWFIIMCVCVFKCVYIQILYINKETCAFNYLYEGRDMSMYKIKCGGQRDDFGCCCFCCDSLLSFYRARLAFLYSTTKMY